MIAVRITWLLLSLLWIKAEMSWPKHNWVNRKDISEAEEKSRWILWLTMIAGVFLALTFKILAFIPTPIPYLPRQAIALTVVAAGLALRYAAVKQLGRFFTPDVLIQHEHQLIMDGFYRQIRHPAYTGLLIAFVGAGLAMGDFLALVSLTVPAFLALNYRIRIEEQLLLNKFGYAYRNYCKQTKKWLPWLF